MHMTERIFNALYIHKLLIHHLSIGGWFKRMKLIEVKSLIWAQKGKLYIIYENVMWIQWPNIPALWQKKGYCSDMPNVVSAIDGTSHEIQILSNEQQALVSFKKYMPPPLPFFKVNIYSFPLPHFASIFFSYLWSFRWPNYIVTLPRYFSFRLPHLNISTGPPSDKLDKNSQPVWLIKDFSQWNGYNHIFWKFVYLTIKLVNCFYSMSSIIF